MQLPPESAKAGGKEAKTVRGKFDSVRTKKYFNHLKSTREQIPEAKPQYNSSNLTLRKTVECELYNQKQIKHKSTRNKKATFTGYMLFNTLITMQMYVDMLQHIRLWQWEHIRVFNTEHVFAKTLFSPKAAALQEKKKKTEKEDWKWKETIKIDQTTVWQFIKNNFMY